MATAVEVFRNSCNLGVFSFTKEVDSIMRRLVALATLATFFVVGVGFAEKIKDREKSQQDRIDQGVKSGELTKKEALKLEAQEAKLHREIKKDRKDGGGLTAKERVKIHKKQDNLSKKIYKQKHDKQKRNK